MSVVFFFIIITIIPIVDDCTVALLSPIPLVAVTRTT